jgi:ABC-type sugar transport system ATPase subunit
MTSGAHLGNKGVRTSSSGVAALAGPGPSLGLGLGPGSTSLLGPNGAGQPTLVRNLTTLLARGAGQVRVPRWRQSTTFDRHRPWADHQPPTPVTTA